MPILKFFGFRSSLYGNLVPFVLLFAQVLSLQSIFYPFLLLTLSNKIRSLAFNARFVPSVALLSFTLISLFLRGCSAELMLHIIRYYFGIIFVAFAFLYNRTLRIGPGVMFLFTFFVFLEVFYNKVTGSILVGQFSSIMANGEALRGARIGLTTIRAYGPSLNSSVSGSILAIFLFFCLNNTSSSTDTKQSPSITSLFFIFIAFLCCGTSTGFLVFGFLFVAFAISAVPKINKGYLIFNSRKLYVVFVLASFVILLLVAIISSRHFISEIIGSRANFEYFDIIYQLKISRFDNFTDIYRILFGQNLLGLGADSLGGDFTLLDALNKIGLIGVVGLIIFLFDLCPKKNRIFLLAALISSLHYGALFSLTGQVFFGALCANSLFPLNQFKLGPID